LSGATSILLFRLSLVLVLYAFLFVVIRALWSELRPARRRRSVRGPASPASVEAPRVRGWKPPNIQVVHPADAALNLGEVIALQPVTTIGRESDNDLVVDEDTVSGYHARLLNRGGSWWIEDLKSTNGTLVNDSRVAGTTILRSGDVIQMGRVQLRFST
jgi:FHA domain